MTDGDKGKGIFNWVKSYLSSMDMLVIAVDGQGAVVTESAGWLRWKARCPGAGLDQIYQLLQTELNPPSAAGPWALELSDEEAGPRYIELQYAAAPNQELPVHGLWTLQDKSQERSLQNRLKASVRRLQTVQESANDGIWEWDVENQSMQVSDRGLAMLGWQKHMVSASKEWWFSKVHKDDLDRVVEVVRRHLSGQSSFMKAEFRLARGDGSYMWVLARGMAADEAGGEPKYAAGSFTDIHARHVIEQRLAWEAEHDVLTRLLNRRGLFAAMEQLDGQALTLLLLDFDNFKLINDSMGHAAGDEFLLRVAERLRAFAGEQEVVARLGGDEFVFVMRADGAASEGLGGGRGQDIEDRINSLKAIIDTEVSLGAREVSLRTSIGVSQRIAGASSADQLLREADMAMYYVKRGSARGGVQFYSQEMQQKSEAELQAVIELKRALHDGQMIYHYQPIHNLRDNRLEGVEALLRWRQADGSLVMPDEFLPVATEQGLLAELGRIAVDRALLDFSKLCMKLRRYDWYVSINLTNHDLQIAKASQNILSTLELYGLQPQNLQIEITEQFLLEREGVMANNIELLRAQGVKVAIDDFGTGYSALGYLHKLPFDTLKIDRSFITGLENDSVAQEVVGAIIRVAHAAGHDVVAEGVETSATANALGELGCDHGQGYLYSRAMPVTQLLNYVPRQLTEPSFVPDLTLVQKGFNADRFFDLSEDLLCIAGLDGYFRRVNLAWERVLGLQMEELLSRPYMEFVHPDDVESSRRAVALVHSGEPLALFTNRIRHKEGHYISLNWKARLDVESGLIYTSARTQFE